MFPEPLKAIPINGLEFDQEIDAPTTLLSNGIFTASAGQKLCALTAVTTGSGLTVTVKSNGWPEHAEALLGVIVYTTSTGAPVRLVHLSF